jgi:hypothetical protein
MKPLYLLVAAAVMTGTAVADEKESVFQWNTVINNNDLIPHAGIRTFNSYNPPSVNTRGMVVVRARSRGGPPLGPATHGIYMRDMGQADSDIVRVLDRTTLVPEPNNLGTTFVEMPSFPRIDMQSDMIVTRGNHQPVYHYYLDDGSETRAGTTGIYTNPYGDLNMGIAKLGHVPGFGFLGVRRLLPSRATRICRQNEPFGNDRQHRHPDSGYHDILRFDRTAKCRRPKSRIRRVRR